MNRTQEQLIALGAVFTAAIQVDRLARTGQCNEAAVACLVGSLLAPDTQNATRFDYLPSGLKFWAGLALSDRIKLQ